MKKLIYFLVVPVAERLPKEASPYLVMMQGGVMAMIDFDGQKFVGEAEHWLEPKKLQAEGKNGFLKVCESERYRFCNTVSKQDWNTEMRTAVDDILIMYDQLVESNRILCASVLDSVDINKEPMQGESE